MHPGHAVHMHIAHNLPEKSEFKSLWTIPLKSSFNPLHPSAILSLVNSYFPFSVLLKLLLNLPLTTLSSLYPEDHMVYTYNYSISLHDNLNEDKSIGGH